MEGAGKKMKAKRRKWERRKKEGRHERRRERGGSRRTRTNVHILKLEMADSSAAADSQRGNAIIQKTQKEWKLKEESEYIQVSRVHCWHLLNNTSQHRQETQQATERCAAG